MAPKNTLILCSLVLLALFTSCMKDQEEVTTTFFTPEDFAIIERSLNIPNQQISYEAKLALHMEQAGGMQAPEINDVKALLGRVLFYDTKLSKNNSISCASCHKQELAFSDNVARSKGFNGELTRRNSQALAATANFQSSYGTVGGAGNHPDILIGQFPSAGFFWDERAFSIAEQSRQTIEDNVEMGMDLEELAGRLADVDYYQILFRKAYGASAITEDRILDALQEFVNSFVSADTRFDEGMNQTKNPFVDFRNFSQQENLGKRLFNENCSSCHGSDMSNQMERVAHNGLEIRNEDFGVGGVSMLEEDEGKFKVPFLRNVALTGPYMHDGRFGSLEEVVDHYNEGIRMHPNLDFRLRTPGDPDQPLRMNFSTSEKAALVAFLRTLTDDSLPYETRFSDPFWK